MARKITGYFNGRRALLSEYRELKKKHRVYFEFGVNYVEKRRNLITFVILFSQVELLHFFTTGPSL